MTDRVVLRAWVQPASGKPETCGGTSIYIDIPDGLSYNEAVYYIAGMAGGEMARYLAHECLSALGRQKP